MKRRERQRETSAAEKGKVELRRDDLLWKDLLARFFVPMLHSLLPDLARDIDEKRDVVFLDKELRRLARFTRQKGIQLGRTETARNLLRMGLNSAKIAEATGLTMEDVESLKNGREA